ncbi:hypothetical protein [Streptomyces sp. NRRL B-24484]|uniref:hypothetical protein n=1 Tax=Streptomyces sp. NRRL B-24484 TaxID=1463833 RepID=UPI0004C25F42|nr:hypothetical protein [Streptomyces sp. NRRL B-24484]
MSSDRRLRYIPDITAADVTAVGEFLSARTTAQMRTHPRYSPERLTAHSLAMRVNTDVYLATKALERLAATPADSPERTAALDELKTAWLHLWEAVGPWYPDPVYDHERWRPVFYVDAAQEQRCLAEEARQDAERADKRAAADATGAGVEQ